MGIMVREARRAPVVYYDKGCEMCAQVIKKALTILNAYIQAHIAVFKFAGTFIQ